ncbi:hypothetical protein QAD02_011563 [Eretmocerus hayati]|uniref:Uncharacterized protein n=1 Tax=Eretmocerus hayati TaxID=131215 RepID=A0ACC2P002_9HYME|nr:hypothetical protein QAD02_011563 [Eretmocerus hayati]
MAWSIALMLILSALSLDASIVTGPSELREPPPPHKTALMARYIVNEAEWTSIATISTREDIVGYPFVNLKSHSDGQKGQGNGVPYLYLTPMDFSGKDVETNANATLLMSLVQGSWCAQKNYDPMDPRCARIILTGKVKKISENDTEHEIAKEAIFGRHEWLAHMPPDHGFYFAKFDIETIAVIAKFGGAEYVPLKEYYAADQKALSAYAKRYR